MLEVLGEEGEPLVEQLPVEGTPGTLVLGPVLQVVVVDDVDEGADGGPVVAGDGVEQGGQPVDVGLCVRVLQVKDSIQFNSLFHFTQGNTILTVFQIIYVNNKFTDDLIVFWFGYLQHMFT